MAVKAVQRARARGPVLRELAPVAAIDLKAGPPRVGGAHLEASGEDDAVHLVLDAVEHQPGLGHSLDAAAQGIHQSYVRSVERGQIVVIEGRPLTELAVPGLQSLC